MNRKAVLIVLLTAVLLAACRLRHNDYSDFHTFGKDGWAYTDTIVFTPELDDSVTVAPLTLCVRHSNAYPYSNLWLELEYPVSDSTTRTDTVQLILADDFGRWHGNGSGVSYQFSDTLSHTFKAFRHREIKIRNIMRRDTLPGIEQIGIFID